MSVPPLPTNIDNDLPDEIWEPDKDFNELYIHIDQNNNCIISGPKEKLKEIKSQIVKTIDSDISQIIQTRIESINSISIEERNMENEIA